jgi:hypothetical protein
MCSALHLSARHDICLVQRIYWLVTSDMPYRQHAWGTPIAGNKVLCTCRGDLDFPNIFRATVPVHESTYCCHRGSVQTRSRVPMRYTLRLNGDLVIVVLLSSRPVKETTTPPSRHSYRTVEPYVNSCTRIVILKYAHTNGESVSRDRRPLPSSFSRHPQAPGHRDQHPRIVPEESLDYLPFATPKHGCLPRGSTRISGCCLTRLVSGLHFAMAVLPYPARPTAERRGTYLQYLGFGAARLLHANVLHRSWPHPE